MEEASPKPPIVDTTPLKWVFNTHSIKNQMIRKTQHITWNIDHRLKLKMKHATNHTIFRSDDTPQNEQNDDENDEDVVNEDAMFVIIARAFKPNIYSYPDLQFYIMMHNDIDCLSMHQIIVKLTMICWQLNINQTHIITFDENNRDSSKYHNNSNRLSVKKCNAQSLTITAEIELQIDDKLNIEHTSPTYGYGKHTIDKQWDKELYNVQYETMKRNHVSIAYINDIQQSLLSKYNDNTFYNIAEDIKHLCLLYMDDTNIIQNTINIEWILSDAVFIDAMLSASNGMKCKSNLIHSCNIDWQFLLYSNGKTERDIGSCILSVKPRNLPKEWNDITLCLSVECVETMTKHTNIVRFDNYHDKDVTEYDVIGLISREEMHSIAKHRTQITFKIYIEMLRIYSLNEPFKIYKSKLSKYGQDQTIEWRVNGRLMKMMQKWDVMHSENQKRFENSNYDAFGYKRLWCLRCNPCNADSNIQIDLQMIGWPSNISRLQVKYRIYLKGLRDKDIEYCDYQLFDDAVLSTERNINHFCIPFNEFANYNMEDITFCADVQIMNEYDIEDNDVTSCFIGKQWIQNMQKWKYNVFCNEYEWMIHDKSHRSLSDVFSVGNLRFLMELKHSNDMDQRINLKLLTMDDGWKCVYVSVRIQCDEHRLCTVIRFDGCNDDDSICINCNLDRLMVKITLLKIELIDELSILYEIPFNEYKRQQTVKCICEWRSNNILQRNVCNENEMWCLRLKNNKICVQLHVLPQNVSVIEVEITYRCDGVNKSEVFAFDYSHCCSDGIHILDMPSLESVYTFSADIVVLRECDGNGFDVTNDNIEKEWKYLVAKRNIVYGYLRRLSLCVADNIFYLCSSYLFDLFLDNYGEYIWKMNDINIDDITIVSNAFYMAQLPWKIVVYPNCFGSFQVGLTLLSMPSSWKNISVVLNIKCLETQSNQRQIVQYTKDIKRNSWSDGVLQTEKVMELDSNCLTLIVDIHILRIRCDDNKLFYEGELNGYYVKNSAIKWSIDTNLMNKMVDCDDGSLFISNVYDSMWYLSCAPHGLYNVIAGDVMLGLALYSLPKNVSKLRVEFKLFCVESNVCDHQIQEFSFIRGQSLHYWKSNTFHLSNFNIYDSITFCADISIILEYDIHDKCRALQQIKTDYDPEIGLQLQLLKDEISTLNKKVFKLTEMVQVLINKRGTMEHHRLYQWLCNTVKLEQYYDILVNNGFDEISILKDITMAELQQIGINKLGHRKKLLKELNSL